MLSLIYELKSLKIVLLYTFVKGLENIKRITSLWFWFWICYIYKLMWKFEC
jgi:hypothetical protein